MELKEHIIEDVKKNIFTFHEWYNDDLLPTMKELFQQHAELVKLFMGIDTFLFPPEIKIIFSCILTP